MRILLAEDDERIAAFIIKGLKEESYAVDHALDGCEAYSMAMIHTYDLIISDLMMPVVDGLTLIKKLRKASIQIPVLILTAKDTIGDKVLGLDSGADDYLTKPFIFEELSARVRALLRRKEGYDEKLTIEDLELDISSRIVTRAGQEIELTPKEYALLEFLLRNKGRVITRTTIIEHVWDIHFDSDTNLVDVFISHLRRKIENGFSSKLIRSVRGVGYTIKA